MQGQYQFKGHQIKFIVELKTFFQKKESHNLAEIREC